MKNAVEGCPDVASVERSLILTVHGLGHSSTCHGARRNGKDALVFAGVYCRLAGLWEINSTRSAAVGDRYQSAERDRCLQIRMVAGGSETAKG